MNIITCASYHGTGSSAVTDLLEEYEKCFSLSEYEFRFVQDPEGISDLEYNLIENQHRLNSGHALKRYKRKVDFLAGNKLIRKYEKFFNNHWKEYSYEYIDELTDLSYSGYWHQDVIDKGKIFYTYKRSINKILQKTIWKDKKDVNMNELPKEIMFCSYPSENKFLECTRKYIDKLFEEANIKNEENIIVDQLVPPSNIKRYIRYFNKIKVIIVERDPRDIYCLAKYIWKDSVIPTESVEKFCSWFRLTRKHRELEECAEDKVILIQFEDLIYKYEETVGKIEKFLGLEFKNHKMKKRKFKPNESIKNTRVWEKVKVSLSEIEYIEKELGKYLYFVR